MKLRTAFLSVFFVFLAGAALATPTVGEATQTARYFPVPCSDLPFPGPGPALPASLALPEPVARSHRPVPSHPHPLLGVPT